MMFDKFCIDKIISGEKTVTRRLLSKKRPAIPGKVHKLKRNRTPKTYGFILIKECDISLVGDITEEEAHKEGFDSRKEYIDYFMDINNIDILSDYDLLWRVEFELI